MSTPFTRGLVHPEHFLSMHNVHVWIQKSFIVTTSIGAAFKAQNMHKAALSMQGLKDAR